MKPTELDQKSRQTEAALHFLDRKHFRSLDTLERASLCAWSKRKEAVTYLLYSIFQAFVMLVLPCRECYLAYSAIPAVSTAAFAFKLCKVYVRTWIKEGKKKYTHSLSHSTLLSEVSKKKINCHWSGQHRPLPASQKLTFLYSLASTTKPHDFSCLRFLVQLSPVSSWTPILLWVKQITFKWIGPTHSSFDCFFQST